mmetsp:Transcript_33558/g.51604  ORF Transcript_33558/g.51604 Transcript_33558/m.51604 type:complete len:170 (+) Transcript_33558:658-1167(+)
MKFGSKQPESPPLKPRRQVPEEEKKKDIEGKLTKKYGKGLAMLKKMGGFELGQGMGKNNQGILNPVQATSTAQMGANERGDKKIKKGPASKMAQMNKDEDGLDEDIKELEAKKDGLPFKRKFDNEERDFLNLFKANRQERGKQTHNQQQPGTDETQAENYRSLLSQYKQ